MGLTRVAGSACKQHEQRHAFAHWCRFQSGTYSSQGGLVRSGQLAASSTNDPKHFTSILSSKTARSETKIFRPHEVAREDPLARAGTPSSVAVGRGEHGKRQRLAPRAQSGVSSSILRALLLRDDGRRCDSSWAAAEPAVAAAPIGVAAAAATDSGGGVWAGTSSVAVTVS